MKFCAIQGDDGPEGPKGEKGDMGMKGDEVQLPIQSYCDAISSHFNILLCLML